jgi:CRP-like cAMP-binding protein
MATTNELVRSCPLARELTADEVEALAALVGIRNFSDGEVLLPAGSADNHLHVVIAGRIEVVHTSVQGPSVLARLGPGDLVGELSFMDDEPRYASLIASGPTVVLALARSDLETLLESSPRIVYKVMRAIMRVSHSLQRRLSRELRDMESYIYRTGAKLI